MEQIHEIEIAVLAGDADLCVRGPSAGGRRTATRPQRCPGELRNLSCHRPRRAIIAEPACANVSTHREFAKHDANGSQSYDAFGSQDDAAHHFAAGRTMASRGVY